ncbi:uncharacterized protein K452DRAFT_266968 [Aplosporella prunicola CBS 121167]|uniref:Enoyl reductase (ER) domain-containing protein n=1 Tax=Aplosporella prunicola CBS 121167 TaxID=1176127 RepID=A0A6A6BNK3_9PEZI|nr:uncharacterized protein K452DRAFT_266968 [Aplosporella prunicola CBS 121167]KAF2144824.1 hypothetical protein K452DRAFT_266968 [Aplosporella prunicola CBS 121167]
MTTTKAQVVRVSDGKPRLALDDLPLPTTSPGKALVKVDHVAQNPTDVQSFDSNAFGDGAVLGCDFAGTVDNVHETVTKLKKGDQVAGLIWGGEVKDIGGYSQYSIVDERISFKIPKGITSEQASTVPLAATTAWLSFFSKQCLNIPRDGAERSVLIWGGSSSVGLYAIQEAVQQGLKVITTCSPKHFDWLKKLGAHHVFDYRSEDVVEQIKAVAPDLIYAFDTIGMKSSSSLASKALREGGGTLCTVRPGKANTEEVSRGVQVTDVLVWTAFLKEHRYGEFYWPPSKDDHELAAELFDKLPEWLETGKIQPNPTRVFQGLEFVSRGFEAYRKGEVSGFKIVYSI